MLTRRALLSLPCAGLAGRVLGANDRIHIAVAGAGLRGQVHIAELARQPGCLITAVCDVYRPARERAVAQVERLTGSRPKACADVRELCDDKSVDAVSIATPNHWHALATIWACQAGKDVYVEKPACHNIREGRQMVAAARKYGRVVQVGMQSRSTAYKIRAMKLLAEGAIGRIYLAKGICFKRRRSIGHTPDAPVPAGLDWDRFLGPAPLRPFSQNRFAYNWHWFWDTGNGDIGNQGAHEMDIARWGLGEAGLPRSVVSTGGKFGPQDDQETPNTQLATFDYGGRQLVFEVRGLPTGGEGGLVPNEAGTVGNLFYGTGGWMAVDYSGVRVYKGEKNEKVLDEKFDGESPVDTGPLFRNFLDAVRERDSRRLTADIETGVISASLCHLANISYRLGRKLSFDADAWSFRGDREANRLLSRDDRAPYRAAPR